MFRNIGIFFGYTEEIFLSDLENGVFERSASYSFGAFFFYTFLIVAFICRFAGKNGFWLVFIPLFLNPILFAQVPYPLQEGQAVVLLLPLAAWVILALTNKNIGETILVASLLAGFTWMMKTSFIIMSASILVFLFLLIWRERKSLRERILVIGLALVIATIPVAPQMYSMYNRFSTLDPYPTKSFASLQLALGWGMWRYDTVYLPDQKRFAGLPFLTPFGIKDADNFDLVKEVTNAPDDAAIIAIGHVFSAFNYTNIKTYEKDFSTSTLSVWNVLVGSIIFLGLYGSIRALVYDFKNVSNVFIDGMLYGGAAALPFLAVETRFSLMPLAFLSVRAFGLFNHRFAPHELAPLILGLVMFVAAFMFVAALSTQTIMPGLI